MKKIKRSFQHFMHEILFRHSPPPIKKNMLSCQDVTKNMETEEKLRISDRLKMMVHVAACSCCSDYREHVRSMNEQYKKLYQEESQSPRNTEFNQELINRFTSQKTDS